MKRVLALVSFVAAGCSGHSGSRDDRAPVPPPPAVRAADEGPPAEQADDDPPAEPAVMPPGGAWLVTAQRASSANARIAAARAALGHLDVGARRQVEALLDRAAGLGTGPDALLAAGRLLRENATIADDPDWRGTGTQAGASAVHAAGLALLAGMVSATVMDDPSTAPEVTRRICDGTLPLPLRVDSGGEEDDQPHRAALADEVDAALGDGAARPERGPRCRRGS